MKKLGFLIFGLLLVGTFVTAGLVSYLSNSIQADATFESPMILWFGEDDSQRTMSFGQMFGGETITYTTHALNRGSNPVEVYNVVTEVESEDGFVGGEIESVILYDPRYADVYPNGLEVLDKLYHIKTDGTLVRYLDLDTTPNRLRLIMIEEGNTPEKYTHNADRDIMNEISVTFAPNFQGEVSLTACHLFDYNELCPEVIE